MFGELTTAWRRSVRAAVLKWYGQHGRSLPWRMSNDPYRIWVSEIMLQQTTVAAVIPYFDRFMNRFSSVHELAAADISEVLRFWEGLGYYSRARNLHAAAKAVVTEWDGRFSHDVGELQQLAGVGRYTAGAIASFAFDRPAPIVEANTMRLFSRLMAMPHNAKSSVGQKQLWEFAEWLIDPRHPAAFNQAVMDVGARICRTDEPSCSVCPLQRRCLAFRDGVQDEIPCLPPKAQMTDVTEFAIAIARNGRWLLRQCMEHERWAGLWDFVRFPLTDDAVHRVSATPRSGAQSRRSPGRRGTVAEDAQLLSDSVIQRVRELTGLTLTQSSPMAEIRHVVTRYRIRLIVHVAREPSGRMSRRSGYRWLTRSQIGQLGMPVTGRQIAEKLTESA
jgi:A/G-specific adenine glycosylase